MKKILITGKNSYVGTSLKEYLEKTHPYHYAIKELSVKGDEWHEHDFSPYDVIFHVAGIAHVSTSPKMEKLYYKVNRDLTFEIAKKAKNQGVSHFIFMSSMIVYGNPINGIIQKNTIPNPTNFYGKSKLEAEELLKTLESSKFKISIIRPPMIYGYNSKGNFKKLYDLSLRLPLFPDYDNKRSMLYIENLSYFIKQVIDETKAGIYHPSNKDYVNTSSLVKTISNKHEHKIYMTKIFNPLINVFKKINYFEKVFGNLYYDDSFEKIRHIGFLESIDIIVQKEGLNK